MWWSRQAERLQIEPVELARLPKFLCPSGNRFTITDGEHHFRGAPQHDLMQHERREVIEQVHVIDTHHHRRARGGRSQRLDHAADQLNGVGAIDRTHAVKAPSGSPRAQDVPTAQWVRIPATAESSASRAMRLLPTPAAPQITIPDEPRSDIAASMSRISFERPVNGHVNRTLQGRRAGSGGAAQRQTSVTRSSTGWRFSCPSADPCAPEVSRIRRDLEIE